MRKTILIRLAASLLGGCTAAQQQRFADGYFGEPGHTFQEAVVGNGTYAAPVATYAASNDSNLNEQLQQIRQNQLTEQINRINDDMYEKNREIRQHFGY